MPDEDGGDFGLVCPFWIDTEAYADRDRAMFVAGYEFSTVLRLIRTEDEETQLTVHRENESRIRMACARFGRTCEMTHPTPDLDHQQTWTFLTIFKRG